VNSARPHSKARGVNLKKVVEGALTFVLARAICECFVAKEGNGAALQRLDRRCDALQPGPANRWKSAPILILAVNGCQESRHDLSA
jgi:hypothetical protein